MLLRVKGNIVRERMSIKMKIKRQRKVILIIYNHFIYCYNEDVVVMNSQELFVSGTSDK